MMTYVRERHFFRLKWAAVAEMDVTLAQLIDEYRDDEDIHTQVVGMSSDRDEVLVLVEYIAVDEI